MDIHPHQVTLLKNITDLIYTYAIYIYLYCIQFMQFSAIAMSSILIAVPDVINPAVNTQRQEHVDVNPEGEPALCFSEAQPVHHVWLVYFSLKLISQVTGHCEKTHC